MKRRRTAYQKIALLLVLTMLLGMFTACGKTADNNGQKEKPGSEAHGTVTGVPTATPAPDMTGPDVKPATGTPLIDTDGGILLTSDSYSAGYTSENLPAGMSGAGIVADEAAGKGAVSLASSFTLNTTAAVTAQEVKDALTLTAGGTLKALDYKLDKISETAFRITPVKAMSANTVYRFVIGNTENPYGSFVFQTEAKAMVKALYPRDLATNVATNTGIEMTFSEPLAAGCIIADYFTVKTEEGVQPEGEYQPYPDGKTIVFIPKLPLKENTVYQIEVKAGLPGISGNTLEEAVTAKFRTANDTSYQDKRISISLQEGEITITDGSIPQITYYSWYNDEYTLTFNDTRIGIYQYQDAASCIEAMKAYQAEKADYIYTSDPYRFPLEGLTKVDDYSVKMDSSAVRRYSSKAMQLPELPEGCYLLDVVMSGDVGGEAFEYKAQVILQITDIVLYTESSQGTLLFWVNNAQNGVLENASIKAEAFTVQDYWNTEKNEESYTTTTVSTDKNGLAHVQLNENNAAFVLVSHGGKSAYYCVSGNPENKAASYYSYLYTDREVYFSEDTVNFFGLIAPGTKNAAMPKTLYLETGGSINRIPVSVNSDGSFSGSIPIESGRYWYYRFTLYDENDNYVASKSISVTQEDKPVYTAALSFNKPYYRIGDSVTVTLSASFFDGTPAPGLQYDVWLNDGNASHNEVVTIGADGTASVSYTPDSKRLNSYGTAPVTIWAEAYLIGDELTNAYLSESAAYFNSNMIFEADRVLPEDGSASYTRVSLHKRDFTGLVTKDDLNYPAFPENSYGEPADGTVQVTLTKYEYVKKYAGTEYDPITKTARTLYDYDRNETRVKAEKMAVVNGVLELPHIKRSEDFYGYYTYTIQYTDPDTAKTYELDSYAVEGSQSSYSNSFMRSNYSIDMTQGPFAVGDTIECRLMYGGAQETQVPVLYTIYSGETEIQQLSADGFYSFPYSAELAPGATIYATIQAGGQLYLLYSNSFSYDFESNNLLEVSITTDKDSYKPGEEAVVTITAGTKNSLGNPAFVLLSVVDEACFALGEQYITVAQYLGSTYRWINRNGRFFIGGAELNYMTKNSVTAESSLQFAQNPEVDSTANDMVMEEAATGRGMDSVAVREIFLDNPLFTLVDLKNGTATVNFTVPDNITEWRLSAVVCEPAPERGNAALDTRLGSTTTDVICTLPFFLNAEVNSTFLRGDDIVASARVYGSMLPTGTAAGAVYYEAKLYDESEILLDVINSEALSGRTMWFNFGPQENGQYVLTVKAIADVSADTADSKTAGNTGLTDSLSMQELSDGVKLEFTVTESGTILPIRKELLVSELADINPMLYPLTLSFYDSAYQPYTEAVSRLLYSYGTRYDSLAAYYVAATASEKLFGSNGYRTEELSRIKQTFSGIYGLLPVLESGEGDAALTAKICALAPETLTEYKKQELISIFTDLITAETIEDDVTLTASLFGLAALGEPVLNDLLYVAGVSADYSIAAKLYLAAAFAYLGDFTSAADIYDLLAAKYRREADGEIYFAGATTEESIQLTAYALLSAALIRKTDAKGMYDYLVSHTSTLDLYQLEQSAYVKYFYPLDAKPASFTWTVGGTTEDITLEIGQIYSLTLNKADFAALKLTNAADSLRVRCAYYGGVAESIEGESTAGNMSITKSIEPYDMAKNIYKVTLHYNITTDANYAYYTISDYIPSGARIYTGGNIDSGSWENAGTWSSGSYIGQLSGQSMRGSVSFYRNNDKKLSGLQPVTFSGEVCYLIRGAVEGSFVIDTAVMQNRKTGAYCCSTAGTVAIRDGSWMVEGVK